MQLQAVVQSTGRKVIVGHVLRYAPFYVEVKRRVCDGAIGQILSIHTSERVSYHHMAVGFVRGRWRRRDEANPMLLAKCCHDLDLIAWYMSGVAPVKVASMGNRMHFRSEMAPPGSGERCLVDCAIERTCPFSCRTNYIEQGLWGFYAWECLEHIPEATVEDKLESLRTYNPFGRCVWRCDNDVVDHQTVICEFANGAVASHDMMTGTARPCRTLHLQGTGGEIEGIMEEGAFVVRRPDPRPGHEYREERVDVSVTQDGHGGGDMRLVEDFVRVVRGEEPSLSTTTLDDSVHGHLIAFAADEAMEQGRVVNIG